MGETEAAAKSPWSSSALMSGRARTASADGSRDHHDEQHVQAPREVRCATRRRSPEWWRLASSGPSAVMTETASSPCGSWKNVNAAM